MIDERIEKAIGRCNPDEPLQPEDPRWHNFDQVRHVTLHRNIHRLLRGATADGRYSHIALAGHRGCGKSSELNRVIAATRADGYLPLYTVVNKDADPNEIGFGDLFLLMLRLLETAFRTDPQLQPLPQKTVNVVIDWFRDVTREQEKEIERAITLGGDASLGIDTPLLKLISSLTILRRSTGKQRELVKESVEKYPSQLLQNLNLLLDDAQKIARPAYPRGILFMLDNLDRYPPEMIDTAVLRQGELYNGIAAHVIFVVPISLLYNPPGEVVEDRFDTQMLPMIPLFQAGTRMVDQAVLDEVVEAIFKRVPPDLFASEAEARELARLSGGCPRDLLKLLKEALLASDGVIDEVVARQAASKVRGEIARKLNRAQYRVLAGVYLGDPFNNDETGRFLLYRRAALEYNGERWVGVHPLLWDAPEFKAALQAEREARGQVIR